MHLDWLRPPLFRAHDPRMNNPSLTAAGDSIALAAKLAEQAVTALGKGDRVAFHRLIGESREALLEAGRSANADLRKNTANDDT
ncbi:MAG: hypothetical protein ACYDD1_06130 [Caulobacteraceae bacterium]